MLNLNSTECQSALGPFLPKKVAVVMSSIQKKRKFVECRLLKVSYYIPMLKTMEGKSDPCKLGMLKNTVHRE